LVNGNGFSIHHVIRPASFCSAAFIFNERHSAVVNRWCAPSAARFVTVPGVNPMLNRIRLEVDE
jgi:hypothetical protein